MAVTGWINTTAPSMKELRIISELQLHLPSAFTFPIKLRKRNIWACWLGEATYNPSGVCSPVSSGSDSHHQTARCWFIQAASHLALRRPPCVHKAHSATPSAQRCNEAHPRCPSCPLAPAARRYFMQDSHKQGRRRGGNSVRVFAPLLWSILAFRWQQRMSAHEPSGRRSEL